MDLSFEFARACHTMFLFLVIFYLCLKLAHTIQSSLDLSCENLLPGQYICDSPLIDELTQQPRNCSLFLKAPGTLKISYPTLCKLTANRLQESIVVGSFTVVQKLVFKS